MFEKYLKIILVLEGGYVNNKNDSGGSTNCGITQVTFNNYLNKLKMKYRSVKFIRPEEIRNIYFANYWQGSNSDELCDKGFIKTALVHFDFAVNSGCGKAITYLNKLHSTDFSSSINDDQKASEYLELREDFYYKIAVGKNRVFLKGWLHRLNYIKEQIDKLSD